jgi:hypothetical protein
MGNSNSVLQSSNDTRELRAKSLIAGFIKGRRTKAINEKKIRYMGGKTFLKFFKEDTWPLVEEVFERLNISESKGYDLFKVFAEIDRNENGFICLNEIFGFIKYPRTKFTERLFDFSVEETKDQTVFHNFSKKELSFTEYSIRMWNFCTLRNDGLARYLFEIFDVNELFYLTKSHVMTMYYMLYNTSPDEIPVINNRLLGNADQQNSGKQHHILASNHNIELLREILSYYEFVHDERANSSIITKDQFIEHSCRKTYLIEPIIQFQRHLQKKIGGILYWKSLSNYRYNHPVIKAYDFKSNTLQESIDNIVSSEHDFITTRKRFETQTADYIMKQKEEKLLKDHEVVENELESREKQLKQDLIKVQNNDLLKRMQRKWDVYNKAKDAFLREEFTFDDIWKRREKRLHLYELLDAAIGAGRDYYRWRDNKDVEIVEGTDLDHETRCQDFIANKMIQQQFDPRMTATTNPGAGGSVVGGDASTVNAGSGSADTIVEKLIMNNGKFIYDLLCLVKLYDIVLNDLQTEMESDPKKNNNPAYKEKELTLYNNLIHLQGIYALFQLIQPDDNLVMNADGVVTNGDASIVTSAGDDHPSITNLNQSITTTSSNNPVKGGNSNETLELLLQQNEKQKKMISLIENEQFSEERKLVKKYQKKTDGLLAEKLAHDELLKELKDKMMKLCFKNIQKSQISREKGFFQEEFDLMQNQGSRITRYTFFFIFCSLFVIF